MKPRRIAILISLSALLAGGLGGVAHWNNRSPTSDELLLQRHIASVHVHGISAQETFPLIQKLAGVKIIVDWNAMAKLGIDRRQEIWLDFQNLTVADVLLVALEQLQYDANGDDFRVQNNAIVIAPQSAAPKTLRVFDIDDFLHDPQSHGWPDDDPELAMGLCRLDRYWSTRVLRCGSAKINYGRLCVMQSAAWQEQINTFLTALRQARPDGSGLHIARYRVVGGKWPQLYGRSWSTVVRFYDVRDLTGGAEYIVANRANPQLSVRQTGIGALAYLVAHRGQPRSWRFPGQVLGVAGRLVVEHVPGVQDEVRQTLADIRAARPVDGFRRVHTAEHRQ